MAEKSKRYRVLNPHGLSVARIGYVGRDAKGTRHEHDWEEGEEFTPPAGLTPPFDSDGRLLRLGYYEEVWNG